MKTEEAQTYLAAIVTSSDDAIISKDLNGNITSWNPSAERIFGYPADEAVGRHITLLIPADRQQEEETIIANLRAGKRIEHFETIRRNKTGSLIPVSLTVSPIHDSNGVVIGASKIVRDISERVKAEVALKELSQKKDEFLATMSHELRTPMNAVIGLANILMDSKTLSERDRKFVSTLKMSADNLLELINDLLDFAKIESDSMELEMIEFNLAEELEKSVRLINVKNQEKQLAVHLNYSASLGRFFVGDPLRLQQIVMNLLSNAEKFTEHGGITLSVSGVAGPENTEVTIRVTDTGIGIPPEKLDMIFEKFSQADSSITRRYGGSGLGLAIVKALVEKMGGTIAVESQLGIGTTFSITLPLAHAQRLTPVESQTDTTALPLKGSHKHVLLVEDYEPNILVASVLLEQLGFEFDVAKNGIDAVRSCMLNRYDVILMDVQMHELDGWEATRRIRLMEREKNLPYTPIIAMTAHVSEQDKDKSLEAGMDDFIPKPFDPAELAQKINHQIERRKQA